MNRAAASASILLAFALSGCAGNVAGTASDEGPTTDADITVGGVDETATASDEGPTADADIAVGGVDENGYTLAGSFLEVGEWATLARNTDMAEQYPDLLVVEKVRVASIESVDLAQYDEPGAGYTAAYLVMLEYQGVSGDFGGRFNPSRGPQKGFSWVTAAPGDASITISQSIFFGPSSCAPDVWMDAAIEVVKTCAVVAVTADAEYAITWPFESGNVFWSIP